MPVSKTASLTYVLESVFLDVPSAMVVARFSRTVDGVALPPVDFTLQGAEIVPLLLVPPDASKTRRDDIADAVYALAIQHGVISGEVS
jgi:hypothetical protein